MDFSKLSKIISHALRHDPGEYNISIDEDGWADINDLLEGIRRKYKEFLDLTIEDLHTAVSSSRKNRHELKGEKIRATHGHSIEVTLKDATRPPTVLYHGTSERVKHKILKEGLEPRGRKYVHMAVSIEDAEEIGRRKSKDVIVFKVNAECAFEEGVNFYERNSVWMCEYISPKYLDKL